MIRKSGCKFNLGLNITRRREDGFHDIETLMYPLQKLCDVIEILPSDAFEFSSSGVVVDCAVEKNLLVKAFRLMQSRFNIGNARIHLHKVVPTGAGLGGGSADATTVLMMCNDIWNLRLSVGELQLLAAELGSDTAFFVVDKPQIATGRGEILEPCELSLSGLWIMLIKPDVGVSTSEAYAGVTPYAAEPTIKDALSCPMEQWRSALRNDFEPSIFAKIPLLASLKEQLYEHGAIYASMSGSGSTIFGLFASHPQMPAFNHFTHIEEL